MRVAVLVVALTASAAAQPFDFAQGGPVDSAQGQQPTTPVFRGGIDVLTVEASVLDRDGKPIIDLTPADFTVTLDGRTRRVRDARFYGDGGVESVARAESAVPGPVTNGSADGRIVVFVVDRDSIAPGNEKVVLDAAATVLDGLGPADAAGVMSLPGSNTDLTRDHARVRLALSRMTGARPVTIGSREYNITWDEALGFERRDSQTIGRVIERECLSFKQPSDGLRNPCPPELATQARDMLMTGRFRTQSVMTNLSSLAKQLAPLRGPKQIVFLSSGIPFGQDLLPFYNQFAKDAAEAQIVFYAVHLEGAGADITARKQTVSSAFGGGEFASGMGNAATMTGGAFFMASGSGAGIFARVRTEMNNFYELGIEMQPEDVSASSLEIEVKVSRPGASIRNRRRVLPPARQAANASADPLSDLIRQPIDVAQIPIALSAYTMRGDEASTLRTIVGIEAGSIANNGPAQWAFAVYNEGNVVATGRQTFDAATGPWTAAQSAKLLPGHYRLRAAVIDGAGRAGVVERALDVGVRGSGQVQFSDLLVGVADDNGRLQPSSRVQRGAAMSALMEVISADAATLEKVRTVIEIVPGGSATPVKRFMMGARTGTLAAILTNSVQVPTDDLNPGRYTAIATPMIDETPLAKVTRVFEIVGK